VSYGCSLAIILCFLTLKLELWVEALFAMFSDMCPVDLINLTFFLKVGSWKLVLCLRYF